MSDEKKSTTMETYLLLDCTHMLVVPVESVLLLPVKGTKVVCSQCKTEQEIIRVGTPYRKEHFTSPAHEGQTKLKGV